VDARQVCFDVFPERVSIPDGARAVGYDLALGGIHAASDHPPLPGCDLRREVYAVDAFSLQSAKIPPKKPNEPFIVFIEIAPQLSSTSGESFYGTEEAEPYSCRRHPRERSL